MKLRTTLALTILTVGSALIGGINIRSAVADDQNQDEQEGQVQDSDQTEPTVSQRFNLPIKTGGGTQLWTDYAYRNGCRIQQNSLTGHWRLIDDQDVRRAWGSREACQSELDHLKPLVAGVPTESRHVVVLLHGLMRTHHSMKPLETTLSKAGVDEVIRFAYASTRSSISDHAAALREVIEAMPANAQFSFVGHSMGNIVVRHLLGDLQRDGDPAGVIPRCRSMVMLGPPNQGAAIARRLAPTGLY
ncbi:MAG: lipase, partial [Rubripirellula sp.]